MNKFFITTLFFAFCVQSSYAIQKLNILDIKDLELDFIVNLNTKDSTFTEYFSFQYEEGQDFSFLSKYTNFYLLEQSDRALKVKCDNDTFTFQIYGFSNSKQIVGYGLSKRNANKYQISLKTFPANLIDLITVNDKVIMGQTIDCDSGGEGASACSTESSLVGGASCSVTCKDGYYACCDNDNICKCIADGTQKTFKKRTYILH